MIYDQVKNTQSLVLAAALECLYDDATEIAASKVEEQYFTLQILLPMLSCT